MSSARSGDKGRRGGKTARETVRIESIATGGAGVARLAGGAVVFITGAAPGELVEAELDLGKRPAEGRVVRVVEASPDRVPPPCPYVAECGGCALMHLSAEAQGKAHAAIVESALRHVLPGASLPAVRVHRAPEAFGYRTRARFFVKGGPTPRVGYRAGGSHGLVAVDSCPVLAPALTPLLGDLAEVLAGAKGDGDAQVALGLGGRPVVSLEWSGELPPAVWQRLDARVKEAAWSGARVILAGVSTPATFGDPRPVVLGADGRPLVIAPGGFAQASDSGGAALARRVAELGQLHPDTPGAPSASLGSVIELFAGSGTLSVALAPNAASFTAVEVDREACAAAQQNLGDRGLRGKVVTADADAFAITKSTDLVVLDPPRQGAAGAVKSIAAARARRVVYVSCDPQTLARDLVVLTAAGLSPTHVETFELFPQTSHVEVVVRLDRRHRE